MAFTNEIFPFSVLKEIHRGNEGGVERDREKQQETERDRET